MNTHPYKFVYPTSELKAVGAKPYKLYLINHVYVPEWSTNVFRPNHQ